MTIYHEVEVSVYVRIIENKPSDAITRVTGPDGDEWRAHLYHLHTEDDVLEHWAFNAVANGVRDINELDGWADLASDTVTMTLDDMNPCILSKRNYE